MPAPPKALDHRLLRQFLAVADAGSMRGGAAALNMSQPPLTQAIGRLEETLGARLFDRLPRGVALTPAGAVLAAEARQALARLARAERRVRAATGAPAPLRIGFVSAALNGALTRLLKAHLRRSAARPALQEMTTPEQIEALADGRIDLGFLHPPVPLAEDLALAPLRRDPFLAAAPADHPLAKTRAVDFSAVAAEPLVLFPPEQGPSLMATLERLAFESGAHLEVAATAPRVHSQLALIAAGLGIGLVTRETAATLRFEGVRFLPIKGVEDRLFLELAMVGAPRLLNAFAPDVAAG